MGNYKILNITDTLNKRDAKYNSVVLLDYVDSMKKKTIKINPKATLFLKMPMLPISIQKMRISGEILVTEISDSELDFELNKTKQQIVVENVDVKQQKNDAVKKLIKENKKKNVDDEIKEI